MPNQSPEDTGYRRQDAGQLQNFVRKRTEVDVLREWNDLNNGARHCRKYYQANNKFRSQFINVPLFDENSVELPPKRDCCNFIHANFMDCTQVDGELYIIAQTPIVKPLIRKIDTQENWYRMIWAYEVLLCVSCVELGRSEDGCDYYFDSGKGNYKHKVGADAFSVVTKSVRREKDWFWTLYNLEIENRATNEFRSLRIIMCHEWKNNQYHNKWNSFKMERLLEFAWCLRKVTTKLWRSALDTTKKDRPSPPMVVCSRAGQNRAPVFIVLSILGNHLSAYWNKQLRELYNLPKYFTQDYVDNICHRVRTIRHQALDNEFDYLIINRTLLRMSVTSGHITNEETFSACRVLVEGRNTLPEDGKNYRTERKERSGCGYYEGFP